MNMKYCKEDVDMASSFHEQNAVVHYDDMLENVVNTVKSAYEDEGFDPSSSLVIEAALNAFLMEAYEQEVYNYGSLSAEQINAYKDVVRHWLRINELKITREE